MNDNSLIWSSILDRIKNELDTLAYSTWFSDTNLYELKNGIAKIIVPYDIFRSHISTNYNDVIKKCAIKPKTRNYFFLNNEEYPFEHLDIFKDNRYKEIFDKETANYIFYGHNHNEEYRELNGKKYYGIGSSG
jgi:chromosomal replication initiation ATPase DnaA